MRKLVANVAKQAEALLIGVACGATISIIPIALVNHKHLELLLAGLNWQKKSFIAICIITSAIVYTLCSSFRPKKGKPRQAKLLSISPFIYLGCYTACAAVCQKLNVTVISLPVAPGNADMKDSLFIGADCPVVASVGLIMVILAAVMQVAGRMLGQGEDKTILRRLDWSCLVFMTGVPLIFSVWLPLFALPGAFVVLKWMTKSPLESIIN